ncbi:pyrroline-5-carboxylate reductase family protein [Spiroplasma taiwanense]|uniref:Pyrroline-5-carboxylate reductase n=1 Tax=Spiroplasma taiwanense CT-1 TaxID=1276220 RepID=S5LZK9_9MOLU|nr:pyrroline-5-carboxylate reductase dimerization domain-containing protein [Spiroplasma taiwanense]AGR41147.1 pyrroline-5-carboxylate reductase [Spiroplasma taiwanense CT-1]
MKILFIGTGAMGEAVLKSVTDNLNNDEISIINRNLLKSKKISEKYNCKFLTQFEEIKSIKFDIYIIGVRPIDINQVLIDLDKIDISNSLIISMVNALSISTIQSAFIKSKDISIIRMIPNMNAIIGKSLTSYTTFGSDIKIIQKGVNILKTFGEIFGINEENYPSFVTLTGTSPAYIFAFLNAFEEFGIENNYEPKFLKELIAKQFINTIENWKNNDKKTVELISEICVPNGSTIAGYEVLLENKFNNIVKKCLNKSKEKC